MAKVKLLFLENSCFFSESNHGYRLKVSKGQCVEYKNAFQKAPFHCEVLSTDESKYENYLIVYLYGHFFIIIMVISA